MSVDEVRVLAAMARACGGIDVPQGRALEDLDHDVFAVTETEGRVLLHVAAEHQLHHTDLGELPVARLTPGEARALLAVLVATFDPNARHVYPGRATTVGAVYRGAGADGAGGSSAHLKGALRRLHQHGIVQLAHGDVAAAELPVGSETPVAVGPTVATWSGSWLQELQALLQAMVAEQVS